MKKIKYKGSVIEITKIRPYTYKILEGCSARIFPKYFYTLKETLHTAKASINWELSRKQKNKIE